MGDSIAQLREEIAKVLALEVGCVESGFNQIYIFVGSSMFVTWCLKVN